jgi:TolA-binding protein
MRRAPNLLDDGVQAFRGATSRASDGRATRARVLAAAGRRQGASRDVRRLGLGVVAAILIVLSGAAAWTAVSHWRATTRVTAETEVAASRPPSVAKAAPAAPPAVEVPSAATAPSAADGSEEERLYGRAHEAHFGGREPRAALAAWNLYLRRYPRGAFAPEARYNRALALLRLGRVEAAVAALRPFAAGAFGAYRRDEATALIAAVPPRPSGRLAADADDGSRR